jgi:hypothetical protein
MRLGKSDLLIILTIAWLVWGAVAVWLCRSVLGLAPVISGCAVALGLPCCAVFAIRVGRSREVSRGPGATDLRD